TSRGQPAGSWSSSSSCVSCCGPGPTAEIAPFPTHPARADEVLLVFPRFRGMHGDLEPHGLAVRGGTRTPTGGQLLHQVQATSTFVVGGRTADPGQTQIVVEHLHPHGVGTAAKPEKELLLHRLFRSIFVRDRFQKVAPVLVELVLVRTSARLPVGIHDTVRSEEHTSELQSRFDLVCRLLLEKKN